MTRKVKPYIPPPPLEDEEQKRVVEYCALFGYPLFRIPNETFTKSWIQKQKNKELGVSAGVPDLCIIIHNQLVFIEMKRVRGAGSVVSADQKLWLARMERANIPIRICYGFDEAKAFIDEIAKRAQQ